MVFESSWQFCFAKMTVKNTVCMILNFYVYQVIAMLFDIPNISIPVELIMLYKYMVTSFSVLQGIAVVFDIADRSTFTHLSFWLESINNVRSIHFCTKLRNGSKPFFLFNGLCFFIYLV